MEKKTQTKSLSDYRLMRNVGVTLTIKIVAIVLLGFLFFSAADRITTNDESVANALIGPSVTQNQKINQKKP